MTGLHFNKPHVGFKIPKWKMHLTRVTTKYQSAAIRYTVFCDRSWPGVVVYCHYSMSLVQEKIRIQNPKYGTY